MVATVLAAFAPQARAEESRHIENKTKHIKHRAQQEQAHLRCKKDPSKCHSIQPVRPGRACSRMLKDIKEGTLARKKNEDSLKATAGKYLGCLSQLTEEPMVALGDAVAKTSSDKAGHAVSDRSCVVSSSDAERCTTKKSMYKGGINTSAIMTTPEALHMELEQTAASLREQSLYLSGLRSRYNDQCVHRREKFDAVAEEGQVAPASESSSSSSAR